MTDVTLRCHPFGMNQLVKTQYSNLARASKTGIYYARTKVKGKIIKRSLHTDKLATARRKLPKVLEAMREKAGRNYEYGIFYIAQKYLDESQNNPNLAPKTKHYHQEIVKIFRKTWKGPIEIEDITREQYVKYLGQLFETYSISRVNAVQSLISWIGKWAYKNTVIASLENYIDLPRRTHPQKKLNLPTKTEFAAIEEALKNRYEEFTSFTYWAVIIIARTGARLSELQGITWGDIDFKAEQTSIKTLKGRDRQIKERLVPFIGNVGEIYRKLRVELEDRGYSTGKNDPVVPIKWFNKSLRVAFQDIEKPNMTPHDFRHLFATRCIESGVDIQTVSRWLGHEDGGTLAMKTYVHLLNTHSQKMAKKVDI